MKAESINRGRIGGEENIENKERSRSNGDKGAKVATEDVSVNRGFLSLTKHEPESFYSNDAVAISLVVKCNTLLGFEKKSFPP